ncbi:hypothetical protein LJC42_06950 [Eubacteriales bacterium OttesenSCG-928-K08]|nr:hypothetical protein [Eubacteriales bacterium OttesenSCG-928-K08]
MRFWLRHAVLNLGSSQYTLDDLHFKFKVQFEDRPMTSTATIEIYNLSPTKRATLTKGMPVILSAGYKGDIGTIFVGQILEYTIDAGIPDNVTKITAADSLDAWLGSNINKTYKGPIYAQEILDDLLNVFGIEVAMARLKTNKFYPRGRVCNSKTIKVLTQIVCGDCESRLIIRCGQIIINPPEEGIHSGFLLSPSTGLLLKSSKGESQDAVTQTNASAKSTRAAQNEAEGSMQRVCLMNYRIGCADLIRIQDSATNGTFLVKSGVHEGDRAGNWTTTLEVVPV